ncbi:MAG: ParA family protein [Actinomycetia bacterium]|nr:ParA family protein [Actinomycetes bacterium]
MPAKVISFINQKGGTGKTTVCINLSVALAQLGKKVLIVDLDFQSNATTGLGYDLQDITVSSFELLKENEIQARDIIKKTYKENLSLIPARFDIEYMKLLSEIGGEKNVILKGKLEPLLEDYDFIFIDNPPSLSAFTFNSLFASDYIYIPIEISYFGLEGFDQILNTIKLLNKATVEYLRDVERMLTAGHLKFEPQKMKVGGVIINKWDNVTKDRVQFGDEIEKFLNKRYSEYLFDTKIRNYTRIREAIGEGIGILDYAPDSPGGRDFLKLAEEVINRESQR